MINPSASSAAEELVKAYQDRSDDRTLDHLTRRYRYFLWHLYHKDLSINYLPALEARLSQDMESIIPRSVWAAAKEYDASRGVPFQKYLAIVFRNLLRTEARRIRSEPFGEELSQDLPVPADQEQAITDRLYAMSVLKVLSEESQEALLYFSQGFTYNEIAKTMGKEWSDINHLIFRDRETARKVKPD